MDHALKRRIAGLVIMGSMSFTIVARTSGFDAIRTVQILLLMSSGMCLGVALSLFMHRRTAAADAQG